MSLVNNLPLSLSIAIARTADTNAYLAGDAVGINAAGSPGSAVINFARVVTTRAVIENVTLRIDRATVPAGMAAFRLHLYVGAPTALLDNAAWDLVAGDRSKYQGYVELATPIVSGASTLWSSKVDAGLRIGLTGALYGILVTQAGYTPGSGENYQVGVFGCDG